MADYKLFQSTLPWRERRDYLQGNPRGYNISIHAPAEGATRNPDAVFLRLTYFNPRSRGGSDVNSWLAEPWEDTFQSTLPRRERHMRLVLHTAIFHISIHAPAEGATSAPFTKMELTTISIHAPAEGATSWHRKSIRHKRFQSTLPRRERHGRNNRYDKSKEISIHAPAEGATAQWLPFLARATYFNPRSRGGSDSVYGSLSFQYTYFNPRSRGGSDEQGTLNGTLM